MPRDQALSRIGESLQQSAERLEARGFQARLQVAADAAETKLLVRRGREQNLRGVAGQATASVKAPTSAFAGFTLIWMS